MEHLTPLFDLLKLHVIFPFMKSVHKPYILPLCATLNHHLSPVLSHVNKARDALPLFDIPLNYLGVLVIVLHVINYNFIARLEYNTKLFTKVPSLV
jgi:hypothetical protein